MESLSQISAARGYAALQKTTTEPAQQSAESFVDVLKQAEATASASMTGGADSQALVEALAASELAVETAVTIRDKVVEAYNEILRMPL
ncbi:MAG: flagellar hook-basal body complex protein FliE [Pseudomonadota bacterium]